VRCRRKRELYQLVLADIDVRAAINVADDFIELLTRWPKGKNLPYHLSKAFVAYRRLEGKTLYTARYNPMVALHPVDIWAK
jgi:hypothetical protein